MSIKKTVRGTNLPGVHPALMERIREAESAELKGELPRKLEGPQKILRPNIDVSTQQRAKQVKTTGLVDPASFNEAEARAAYVDQAPFKPGTDLDQVWDTLSETEKIRAGSIERFRLEIDANLERSAMPWQAPHQITGKLDARNLKRSEENLRAEVDAYDYLLAPDSKALLLKFLKDTRELFSVCMRQQAVSGINAEALHPILRDWLHKLLYQELTSRRRAMGDRGIRRICGNIALAERVYEQLKRLPGASPRQRLMMRFIHVHQDLGFTAYAARVSFRGGRLHRAYGARIFTDEMNRYRALFKHDELQLARTAVATHSSEELPFEQSMVLALVRAVDHLAPFAPHRVTAHFATIPGVADYLDDMLDRVRAGEFGQLAALKEHLRHHLEAHKQLPKPLRDDLLASFRPFEKQAELMDLGQRAGDVSELTYSAQEPGGVLGVTLKADAFSQRYQLLFDQQQDQLLRVARNTDTPLQALTGTQQVRMAVAELGALTLSGPEPAA